ncbi:response regulator transcription factor [Oceanobacter kriegii]|uniref:response regulator transcription factor n=1 Tax=Oceanobacter kriegii TaxID=64972 RepID=UPI0004823B22|nr:response regulator transcription factor [Oceanobacter kriegii]
MRVLVVEDDQSVGYWIASKLNHNGHECALVSEGASALDRLQKEAFDVVVLDRGLPDISGIDVLNTLAPQNHPPILMLSAFDQIESRIEGLKAGADDYLCKPFDYTELQLRLEVLIRLRNHQPSNVTRIDDLEIDWGSHSVCRAGKKITLTKREFCLLKVLVENRGKTVSRSMLLEKAWGYEFNPGTNLIDVHMSKLRTKIDKGFDSQLLCTIRNVGYEIH